MVYLDRKIFVIIYAVIGFFIHAGPAQEIRDEDHDGYVDGPTAIWVNGRLYIHNRDDMFEDSAVSQQTISEGPLTHIIHWDEQGLEYINDSDGDGLADEVENASWASHNNGDESGATNPFDADTDDDGILDFFEKNFGDHSPDMCYFVPLGFLSANNPDSDGDGLPDGLECGMNQAKRDRIYTYIEYIGKDPYQDTDRKATFSYLHNGLSVKRLCFIEDADPLSTTNPLSADTNYDGVPDGAEDANANGACDTGETDPAEGILISYPRDYMSVARPLPDNTIRLNMGIRGKRIEKYECGIQLTASQPEPVLDWVGGENIVNVWRRPLPGSRIWIIRVELAALQGSGTLRIGFTANKNLDRVIKVEVTGD